MVSYSIIFFIDYFLKILLFENSFHSINIYLLEEKRKDLKKIGLQYFLINVYYRSMNVI